MSESRQLVAPASENQHLSSKHLQRFSHYLATGLALNFSHLLQHVSNIVMTGHRLPRQSSSARPHLHNPLHRGIAKVVFCAVHCAKPGQTPKHKFLVCTGPRTLRDVYSRVEFDAALRMCFSSLLTSTCTT